MTTTADPTSPTASSARPFTTTLGVILGMVSIVVGLLVLALPGVTLLLAAVAFAVQLLVLGIVRIMLARSPGAEGARTNVLGIVLGVLTILAAVFCLVRPGASLVLLALFLAIGWIADGIADLVAGLRRGQPTSTRVLLVVGGVVSVVAGLVVAVFPGASLLLLARVAGIALIVIGAVQIVIAIARRRQPSVA